MFVYVCKCLLNINFILFVKIVPKLKVGWLVGYIEDLRRFSGISSISRLGSRR